MTKEQAIQELERFNREGRIFATSVHEAIDIAIKTIKEKDKKLEKKDKIIDLIINTVYERFKAELLLEYGFENAEQFKQCFERKVEYVEN